MRYALLVLLLTTPALAQPQVGVSQPGDDAPDALLAALADTTEATAQASLRVEQARLALARQDLRRTTHWSRLRPQVNLYVSVATRGLAFPSISSQGYDPAYAAIARWPGDSWGLTASWSLDQILDRRPTDQARAAVAVAEARISLHQARRDARHQREAALAFARAERDRQRRQRTQAAADLLRSEAGFLARRLDAQRELLRLAEMTYDQGETTFAALARQRLAVLTAEHAHGQNAARLRALTAGLDPSDLALAPPTTTDAGPRPQTGQHSP